jgi:hypothetical protein
LRSIDRIEENLEKLTDVVGRLAGLVSSLAEGQQRLQMAQIETTGKLDALIHIVDERIRNRPQPGA